MSVPRKIVTRTEASEHVRAVQVAGESVVMCHGCFDIVHPGHVRHLRHAAGQGDRLLVSVTGDAAMKKGTGRPLIPQELRAENLAALDFVDWVCVAPEPTALETIEAVRPDVYIKGREYEHNADPRFAAERDAVERHGGRVVFSAGDVVFSSTALIAALAESANPFHARLRDLARRHDVAPGAIETLLASFVGRRVLVVGETIIDRYVLCDRPEVAGESPVMTLRPVEDRAFDGGAAIIARHLAAMGARPTLLTALPRTPEAERIRQRLGSDGIAVEWIDADQPLVEKQRFLVGTQKVMKLDLGRPLTLDAAVCDRLVEMASAIADQCDAAIVADFGQGLLSPATLTRLCEAVRPRVRIMSGDVSGRRASLMALRDLDLVCPSESELRDALHDYDEGLGATVWEALDRIQSRAAIVSLGADGAIAFDRIADDESSDARWNARLAGEHVPSFAPFAVDQLGCGDAMLAAATLTLLAGGSLVTAAIVGAIAAGEEALRFGNAVIGAPDLRRGVRRLADDQLVYAADMPAVGAL